MNTTLDTSYNADGRIDANTDQPQQSLQTFLYHR
jgi:hypothetical protein